MIHLERFAFLWTSPAAFRTSLDRVQDRGYKWKGQKEDENVFKDAAGKYEPDDPSTQEVKFKKQEPEENAFDDLKVGIESLFSHT